MLAGEQVKAAQGVEQAPLAEATQIRTVGPMKQVRLDLIKAPALVLGSGFPAVAVGRLVVVVGLLQGLVGGRVVLVRAGRVHVVLRVGGVGGGGGRCPAVDVLLVAQLVVVQQRVVPG